MISSNLLFIDFTKDPVTWVVWSLILIVLFFFGFLLRNSGHKISRKQLIWFTALAVVILFTSTIIAIRIQTRIFIDGDIELILLPLVSLPWMLAAGLIGVIPSLLLALASGFLYSVFYSHQIFSPIFFTSLALFFNYLIGIKRTRFSEATIHTPLSAAFWTGVLAIILIPLRFLFSPEVTRFNYIELNKQLLLETIISVIPGILISAIIVQILSKEVTDLWAPYSFQRPRISKHPVYRASEMINLISDGNYYQRLGFSKTKGRNSVLLQNIENLRASLEAQTKISSKLIGLEKLDLKDKPLDVLIATVLRAAIRHEGSSARIILFGSKLSDSHYELKIRQGLGKMNRAFAYLDEIVISRLQDKSRIILSDLKNEGDFDFGSNATIPKSLIALNLEQENSKLGVLWIGFDENYWFTEEDLVYYEILAQRTVQSIILSDQTHKELSLSWTLNNILDQFPDPLLYFDKLGNLVYLNMAARRLKDLSDKLMANTQFKELLIQNQMADWVKNDQSSINFEDLKLSDDSNYQVMVEPINLENKKLGTLCILKDTSQLRKSISKKTEFIANVSHDLRMPLSLMKGYITMLPNIGTLNDQQQLFIERILTGIENMNKLVNNVLNAEGLEVGAEMQFSRVILQEAVQNAIRFCELSAFQKKIRIETDYGNYRSVIISGDQILIQQALLNLLDNAIKFSPQGSKVNVSFEKTDTGLRLVVQDEGSGIAPLDQPRVFERYYKRQTTKDYTQTGYGLGLAIVKSIVEKHGASIGLTSQLGKGSIFYIDLPEKIILSWG